MSHPHRLHPLDSLFRDFGVPFAFCHGEIPDPFGQDFFEIDLFRSPRMPEISPFHPTTDPFKGKYEALLAKYQSLKQKYQTDIDRANEFAVMSKRLEREYERLATVQSKLIDEIESEHISDMQGLQGICSNLFGRNKDLNELVDILKSSVKQYLVTNEELQEQIKLLETQIETFDERFEHAQTAHSLELKETIEELEYKISAIGWKSADLEIANKGFANKVTTLEASNKDLLLARQLQSERFVQLEESHALSLQQVSSYSDALCDMEVSNYEMETKNAALEESNAILKESVAKLASKLVELTDCNSNLQYQNGQLRERLSCAEDSLAEIEDENNDLTTRNTSLSDELEKMSDNLEKMSDNLEKMSSGLSKSDDHNNRLQVQNEQLKAELSCVEDSLTEVEEENIRLENSNAHLEARLIRLDSINTDLASSIADIECRLRQTESNDLMLSRSAVESLRTELKEKEEKIDKLLSQLKIKDFDLDRMRERIEELVSKNTHLEKVCHNLEMMCDNDPTYGIDMTDLTISQ